MPENCNIWGTVDFGNGPVEVRCTEVDDHLVHKTVVYIPSSIAHERRNIFDDSNQKP